jgi:hypothetical protein
MGTSPEPWELISHRHRRAWNSWWNHFVFSSQPLKRKDLSPERPENLLWFGLQHASYSALNLV